MSNFKTGDTVVCKDVTGPSMGHLDMGMSYEVEWCDGTNIKLVGVTYSTKVWRFESLEEWASHQKRVSAEEELTMSKLQIASLQELKRNNEKQLRSSLNSILWLYRRLPQAYRNVPSIDLEITKLCEMLGEDYREYLLERKCDERTQP